jgi:hypothetical protein
LGASTCTIAPPERCRLTSAGIAGATEIELTIETNADIAYDFRDLACPRCGAVGTPKIAITIRKELEINCRVDHDEIAQVARRNSWHRRSSCLGAIAPPKPITIAQYGKIKRAPYFKWIKRIDVLDKSREVPGLRWLRKAQHSAKHQQQNEQQACTALNEGVNHGHDLLL